MWRSLSLVAVVGASAALVMSSRLSETQTPEVQVRSLQASGGSHRNVQKVRGSYYSQGRHEKGIYWSGTRRLHTVNRLVRESIKGQALIEDHRTRDY